MPINDAKKINSKEGDFKPTKNSNSSNSLNNQMLKPSNEELIKGLISVESMFGMHGVVDPIAEKIKPETLDKLVDNKDKHDEREFKDRESNRKNTFLILVVLLIFIFAIIVLLKDGNEDLLKIILPLLIGLLSGGGMGAFGGYNWGYKKGREKSEE